MMRREELGYTGHHQEEGCVVWGQAYRYTYSGVTKQAHLWTPALLALKKKVEEISGARYNSCLLICTTTVWKACLGIAMQRKHCWKMERLLL